MRRNIWQVAIFFSLILLVFGCDKIFASGAKKPAPKAGQVAAEQQMAVPVKGTVIARVNNMPVTLEDLNQEIEGYNGMVPPERPEAKISTREQKIEYLKTQKIRQLLLYQAAIDKGLDRTEEVLKALDKTKQDLVVVELVRQEADKVEVSSKDIEDYYNQYKDQLREPEERQIREIMVPTEAEAKEIIIQLMQGSDFATLAKEKSKASSSKDGGDTGFIKPDAKFPQYIATAFSDTLDVGRISSIFKGPDGYYILKLEAKRGGKERSLSEMWEDIKKGLTFLKQQQKIEELIGKLSSEAKIEVYEGEVK
jgi:peptidyl-prolyl cis-trans isomerase C